jgi:hypothetical protein
MSAMAFWLAQRGWIALVLSLFSIWVTYYLWTGEPESLSPRKWGVPKNSVSNDETNIDYNGDKYHYAFHTKTYAPSAAPKGDSRHQEDYDNHFAIHNKTFAPTAAAVKVQATPVHTLIMDEFDETPIRELCAQTSWGPSRDVVINCEGRLDGVGMLWSTV